MLPECILLMARMQCCCNATIKFEVRGASARACFCWASQHFTHQRSGCGVLSDCPFIRSFLTASLCTFRQTREDLTHCRARAVLVEHTHTLILNVFPSTQRSFVSWLRAECSSALGTVQAFSGKNWRQGTEVFNEES